MSSDSETPSQRSQATDVQFRRLVESVSDYAIFLLDTQGNVATWNPGAQKIKGYAAGEIIGRHFSTFYPPDAVARDWPAHELRMATREGHFEDEGWRIRKDGSRFWASVVIAAVRGDDGELLGFSKVTRDLTERRAYEERLRVSEERFRLLLEGVVDHAVFMLDPAGLVSSWNPGAQRITGYSADEIIGHSFERFFIPEDRAQGHPAAELRRALLNRRAEDRGWRLRKDGTRFWADVVVTSLHDENGELRGYAKVVRDLSEAKRAEVLEEEGRHLTEFLAMLAHELRNPLAPIRNALGIMAMSKDASPQVAWSREVIERQTTQLSRLVDDLLDVSRITRGKLHLKPAIMDLTTAALRAVESSRPLLDRRKHRLHMALPEAAINIHGDLTRLTQVILNLLNNAAKYTPEGGDVWLELSIAGKEAVVKVRDNGAGIAPQMLASVFDLFAQGERTIDRSEGGLGIGLTLARRIVAMHGGEIEARSAGPGHGSEFEVRLPLLDRALLREPMAAEADVPGGGPRRSILVVEDNADAATSMALLLRMMGHHVDVESDGPAALERAAMHAPDVVLLDIGLPGMSGYDVAKRLRTGFAGKSLRIVALTGYGQEEDRARALASGFDGHLVKPVMPADLFNAIDGAGA